MNLDPTDIKSWLVDGTVADVKSVLAGYIYDGAQLDDSDVWDIRRTVVCDAIIEGLTGSMPLLKMASRARVKKTTYIPEYFLGVMERGLPLKLPPLCHLRAPQRTAARLAHQLRPIGFKTAWFDLFVCYRVQHGQRTGALETSSKWRWFGVNLHVRDLR